ncbi:hypothetical protein [Pseudonocardia alni]|uniref:DUF7144 family membrane protein n=1 Tax=Pseudonocardia alni TaxID=33907 RepID=UPI00386935ED
MSVPPQAATTEPPRSPTMSAQRPSPAPWVVGLSLFAAVMMIVAGVFNALEGFVALFYNEVYLAGPRYVFAFDLTTWGWIHLLAGIALVAAGFAVMSGRLWGRVVGIAITLLSMPTNFLFIPYYPVWYLLIIALDVFVIWALCVYDRDSAAA